MCVIQIRAAGPADGPFLLAMLLEAVNFLPDRQPDAASVLNDPQVANYLAGWPRDRDRGLLATNDEGLPVGACWLRYRSASDPGYGYISDEIPELTIAVRRGSRGQGIGRVLLQAIADDARVRGVTTLSLSVERANHTALHLYRSEGWRVVSSDVDAETMVLDLAASRPAGPQPAGPQPAGPQ